MLGVDIQEVLQRVVGSGDGDEEAAEFLPS